MLRQMYSMNFYLNTDTVNHDESDLLTRVEWINSLNLIRGRHRWKNWILGILSDYRYELSAVIMKVKGKLNRELAAHCKSQLLASTAIKHLLLTMRIFLFELGSLGCQIWKLIVFMDPILICRIFSELLQQSSEMKII